MGRIAHLLEESKEPEESQSRDCSRQYQPQCCYNFAHGRHIAARIHYISDQQRITPSPAFAYRPHGTQGWNIKYNITGFWNGKNGDGA